MILQPVHQREIVGQTAQQGHTGVGMGVDQAGNQHMPIQIEAGHGTEPEGGFRLGQNGENTTVLNCQRMMFQNQTFRLGGNDPSGIQQGSDGLRHGNQSLSGLPQDYSDTLGLLAQKNAPASRGG